MDVFIFLGPNPQDVAKQYATITGTATLPPVSLQFFYLSVVL